MVRSSSSRGQKVFSSASLSSSSKGKSSKKSAQHAAPVVSHGGPKDLGQKNGPKKQKKGGDVTRKGGDGIGGKGKGKGKEPTVTFNLEEEEDEEMFGDEEVNGGGMSDGEREGVRVGFNPEEDEDEEIDSDAAWGDEGEGDDNENGMDIDEDKAPGSSKAKKKEVETGEKQGKSQKTDNSSSDLRSFKPNPSQFIDLTMDDSSDENDDGTGPRTIFGARLNTNQATRPTSSQGKSSRNAKDQEEEEDESEGEGDSDEYLDAAGVLDADIFPGSDSSGSESGSDDDQVEDQHLKGISNPIPSPTTVETNSKKRRRLQLPSPDLSDEDDIDSKEGKAVDGLTALESFISGLGDGSREAENEEGDNDDGGNGEGGNNKRRKVLKEKGEAWDEGDWVAVGRGDNGASSSKVTLDDLLSNLQSDSKSAKALRKSLKTLAPTLPEKSKSKSSSSKSKSDKTSASDLLRAPGPLATPLPLLHQNRIERKAAYDATKKEVEKWDEVARVMRGDEDKGGKEDRLILPLKGSSSGAVGGGGEGGKGKGSTGGDLVGKFVPSNSLESSISNLLQDRQMSAKSLQTAESEATASLTPKELAQRTRELRKQREIMFSSELKAKRVAKIKSKAFRKILKKKKQGKGKGGEDEGGELGYEEKMNILGEMDKLDGGDRVRNEIEKMEVARAKERISMRHSSGRGKNGGASNRWVTKMKGMELDGLDEDASTAMKDRKELEDQLRKKVVGSENEESDDDDDDDSDPDEAPDTAIQRYKSQALAELDSLKNNVNGGGDPTALASMLEDNDEDKPKGTYGMKFMQRARENERLESERRMEQFRKQIAGDGDDQSGEVGFKDIEGIKHKSVDGNKGRMMFGPTKGGKASGQQQLEQPMPPPIAQESEGEGEDKEFEEPPQPIKEAPVGKKSKRKGKGPSEPEEEVNPWLAPGQGLALKGPTSRRLAGTTDGLNSAAEKSSTKMRKQKAKEKSKKLEEEEDAQVEIDLDSFIGQRGGKSSSSKDQGTMVMANGKGVNGKGKNGVSSLKKDESESDDSEESDGDDGKIAFKQRDLVARAFAGDDVVAAFDEQKQQEIEKYAPKEQDLTLPGWGSWAGKDITPSKKPPKKKHIRKIPGITPQSRKDASLSHVIISEKKDKKATQKLMTKDLPFPYNDVKQYEHSLKEPMGREWVTGTRQKEVIGPRVVVRQGETVKPLAME